MGNQQGFQDVRQGLGYYPVSIVIMKTGHLPISRFLEAPGPQLAFSCGLVDGVFG